MTNIQEETQNAAENMPTLTTKPQTHVIVDLDPLVYSRCQLLPFVIMSQEYVNAQKTKMRATTPEKYALKEDVCVVLARAVPKV